MYRIVDLEFEKSTKNTHRFKETGPKAEQAVGVLYVQKSAFDGDPPSTIKLVITDGPVSAG